MTETYQDVEILIHSICHSFLVQKHISEYDYEEWFGEACLAFVYAHGSYEQKRGARFTTWIWHCVWNALSDKLRREAPHWTTPRLSERTACCIIDDHRSDGDEGFDCSQLSGDAKAVTRIVLGTYGHVDEIKAKPEEIRLALTALLSSMGWSWRRIVESFCEIRIVLTE